MMISSRAKPVFTHLATFSIARVFTGVFVFLIPWANCSLDYVPTSVQAKMARRC